MNAVLHTDKLAKKFGKVEALSSLTLAVPEGSVFALVGPNGAGKTTLLNLLMGVGRIDSGTATVLGHDVEVDRMRDEGRGVLAQSQLVEPRFELCRHAALSV